MTSLKTIARSVVQRHEESLTHQLQHPDRGELIALVHQFGTEGLSPLWRVNH